MARGTWDPISIVPAQEKSGKETGLSEQKQVHERRALVPCVQQNAATFETGTPTLIPSRELLGLETSILKPSWIAPVLPRPNLRDCLHHGRRAAHNT